ncbi:bifunctional ornithine acetyltransferase/N-acetylglutamate synthase [Butyrivibrio sp. INlla16]|uniref:bifunctional ornithine acetyltransferase/N-acetylglutamate synthase n=1 Tax=Butyrivibrio sp. INlla16 TaxID=1520807 RepID=UPI000890F448|nr:bifunctional ornithine acetyltransferase/N-acetylglutamate synthase [Butyrivibrio sp. INlla16]SDB62449.1 glutamate N-acetyltransferase [Butyrivibrio sp. INlla16]
MKIITGGVTAAKGFKAAGAEANIKYKDRKDMMLIYSESPCTAAGVFTSNVVKAAPVLWDKEICSGIHPVHAIVGNSGIANACTGEEGKKVCADTAAEVELLLNLPENSVLVASTGVIGMQMNMDAIKRGIAQMVPQLSDSEEAGTDAAKAIMTTDTYPKQMAVTFEVGGKQCTMGALAKGSGMIHPNMCTMLSFITTDVSISHELLQKALKTVVVDTFNMISVDGDMSTNDSLMVLANGEAGNLEITEENQDYEAFKEALFTICKEMARKLAGDGEGATALFTAHVMNADTKENARTLAKSVICSSLTKAMIYGHDANFGRILCALGYSGVLFDPDKIELSVESCDGSLLLFKNGEPQAFDEEYASKVLSTKEVIAKVDMHSGSEEACAWGCDLTYDYVKINADYRS